MVEGVAFFRGVMHLGRSVFHSARRALQSGLEGSVAFMVVHEMGQICHDLGILGRYEKFSGNRECYRQHPIDSVVIARVLANDLSDKSADIIERHTWPAAHSKRPNSLHLICPLRFSATKCATLSSTV